MYKVKIMYFKLNFIYKKLCNNFISTIIKSTVINYCFNYLFIIVHFIVVEMVRDIVIVNAIVQNINFK